MGRRGGGGGSEQEGLGEVGRRGGRVGVSERDWGSGEKGGRGGGEGVGSEGRR